MLHALVSHVEDLRDVDLTVYIDSSAAIGAIRHAYSRSLFMGCIAGEIFLWCERHQVRLWLMQVPSKLNPADPLSRLELAVAVQHGWRLVPSRQIKWTAFDPRGACEKVGKPINPRQIQKKRC